ncbi:transcriptional regulator, IclR family [Pseudomonas agarici]|nr:transcriptional regulator, IclR family [Pseudomonas agarici]
MGISRLSRSLGVSKSTVHRLASTLLAENLLEQDPATERYRLGLGLFSLGALVRQRLTVTGVSKELLTELRDEVRENVELAILNGRDITYLYDFESPQAVRLRSRLGVSVPAIDGALGMAITAFQSDETINEFIKNSQKPLSAAEKKAIKDEIQLIRTKGFAAEKTNSKIGAVCVAAPVRDAMGSVTASIGVTVPHQRTDAKTMNMLSRRVLETAAEISLRLGYISEQASLYT